MTRGTQPRRDRWQGRRRILAVGLAAGALVVLGRAFQLQVLEGARWTRQAAEQQRSRVPVPARRGGIFDRNGVALALSVETFGIAVAPRELAEPREAAARLVRVLGLSERAARRATDRSRRWVVLPGRFSAEQRERLAGIRGIHFERKLARIYPRGGLAREVLGRLSGDGRALGGIEQEMDSVLRGQAGWSVVRRDARGRELPSLALPVVPPEDGSDVYLTLDANLQEIADASLLHAMDSTGASGGDMLLADPRTGELLAAVSRRRGSSGTAAAFTEPYEPGSTLKPFFVATLLARRRVGLSEQIYAEQGSWKAPGGRIIRDIHPHEMLSLPEAVRQSSNIVMAKLTARLSPGEQFLGLRDFGFGTLTGIEYPAEAAGRLRRPAHWSSLTPSSVAMGYEISVTPLQMVMGYAALANGGALWEPRLVREVRRGTRVVRRTEPRQVRRAIPEPVADQLREVLVSVVEQGTAKQASLATFQVAGKTGTARRVGPGGRYVPGSYTSSFVGFFPARRPQLAMFVKLDDPQGEYYGGLTAAPVTREALQAILAARSLPTLDRPTLLASRLPAPAAPGSRAGFAAASGSEGPYVFNLRDRGGAAPHRAPRSAGVAVPEVSGLPLRDAVRLLHARGFYVRLRGTGVAVHTEPAVGTVRPKGDTLMLVAEW